MKLPLFFRLLTAAVLLSSAAHAQKINVDSAYVRQHYTKTEQLVPMRDGRKLHTVIYAPTDVATKRYPVLMNRTPYSAGPYGADTYKLALGPSPTMMHEGYIFAFQDVRGRYMSEGEFVDMRPAKGQATRQNRTSTKAPTRSTPSSGW